MGPTANDHMPQRALESGMVTLTCLGRSVSQRYFTNSEICREYRGFIEGVRQPMRICRGFLEGAPQGEKEGQIWHLGRSVQTLENKGDCALQQTEL
jgi:hypothetical protein